MRSRGIESWGCENKAVAVGETTYWYQHTMIEIGEVGKTFLSYVWQCTVGTKLCSLEDVRYMILQLR